MNRMSILLPLVIASEIKTLLLVRNEDESTYNKPGCSTNLVIKRNYRDTSQLQLKKNLKKKGACINHTSNNCLTLYSQPITQLRPWWGTKWFRQQVFLCLSSSSRRTTYSAPTSHSNRFSSLPSNLSPDFRVNFWTLKLITLTTRVN